MKIILSEAEIKEALICWGVETGRFTLPDDFTIKLMRKQSKTDDLGCVRIEFPLDHSVDKQ